MNKTVYDLLLKLEQCDDFHNRCDYLMEHDEITYLLEYIEEKHKQLEKYKNVIDKIKEIVNNNAFFDPAMPNCMALGQKSTLEIKKLLEEVDGE